jgi:hypothetical protein
MFSVVCRIYFCCYNSVICVTIDVHILNDSPQVFPIPGRAAQTANGDINVRAHCLSSRAYFAILWAQKMVAERGSLFYSGTL